MIYHTFLIVILKTTPILKELKRTHDLLFLVLQVMS
jgi:hypothetical protein